MLGVERYIDETLTRFRTFIREYQLGTLISSGRKLMAPTRDPVLTVWQAMNLLQKVHVQSDFPDISRILAEAEIAVFNLVLVLAKRENAGLISSKARVITH